MAKQRRCSDECAKTIQALEQKIKSLNLTIFELTQELKKNGTMLSKANGGSVCFRVKGQQKQVIPPKGKLRRVVSESDFRRSPQIPAATTVAIRPLQTEETCEKSLMSSSAIPMSTEGVDFPIDENGVKEEPVDEFIPADNLLTEPPSTDEDIKIDIKEEEVNFGYTTRYVGDISSVHEPRTVDESSDIPVKLEIDRSIQKMFRSTDQVSDTARTPENVGTMAESCGRKEPHLKTLVGEKIYTCKTCLATFGTLFKLRVHYKSHTGEKRSRSNLRPCFKCYVCKKYFSLEKKLTQHMETHSGDKSFTSLQVGKWFSTNRRNLNAKKVNIRRPYKKPRKVEMEPKVSNEEEMPRVGEETNPPCEVKGTDPPGVVEGIDPPGVVEGIDPPCVVEGTDPPGEVERIDPPCVVENTHMIAERQEETQVFGSVETETSTSQGLESQFDEICENEERVQPFDLTEHKRPLLGQKRHWCKVCGEGFYGSFTLMRHKCLHTGERGHKCDICGKNFLTPIQLCNHKLFHEGVKHKFLHTREKIQKSVTRRKRFSDSSQLDKHKLLVHTGEKRYKCEVCQKSYFYSSSFERHKEGHLKFANSEQNVPGTGPTQPTFKFKCDKCGKCLRSTSALTEHSKVHTGIRPFTCDECGKGCLTKRSLNRHKFVHNGEKVFKCEMCGEEFSWASGLTTHKRCHKGHKSCEICGQNYVWDFSLIKHTRETVCQYEGCGKSFFCSSQLNRHELTHREKRYKCELCDKRFFHWHSLKGHREQHGVNDSDSQQEDPEHLRFLSVIRENIIYNNGRYVDPLVYNLELETHCVNGSRVSRKQRINSRSVIQENIDNNNGGNVDSLVANLELETRALNGRRNPRKQKIQVRGDTELQFL